MPRIAVVIPCYRVKQQVLQVIARIGPEADRIICVDDGCPEGSGEHIRARCQDPRVRVLFHEKNQGVGGAVITGYREAMSAGADIIVKLDGDGQMDPKILPRLVRPILEGQADYAKGNRFYSLEFLRAMPLLRKLGNMALSFMSKFSSGYYDLFDPTNGFTAIHAAVAGELPLDKIAKGYFFESDMLFRLNVLRAVVFDVPMPAVYGDEQSSLRVGKILPRFLFGHLRNFCKRIGYNYFLRDFKIGSLELLLAAVLLPFGTVYGLFYWITGRRLGLTASAGTVMLAALPIILGFQLLLSFLNQDMSNIPRRPIHGSL
jgi:glycosyltransferase involved in cell wall biosynthesis